MLENISSRFYKLFFKMTSSDDVKSLYENRNEFTKKIYTYSKDCICRNKNNKNRIYCLGKCGNYDHCTDINCYKLYVDANDKIKLISKPKNKMSEILMSDEIMNLNIKKPTGKNFIKKPLINIGKFKKDDFLSEKIFSFNKHILFSGSDINSDKYLTNIFSKINFLLKSNTESSTTSFIHEGKKYFLPLINNQVLWGREVFDVSSNHKDGKKNYMNIIVEINLLVQYEKVFGRLIFSFKKNENMKISILPGLCPLMFTKHCDQQSFLNYFKSELKSNLIFKEDENKIDEFFCSLSLVKCNVLIINKNIIKKYFQFFLKFIIRNLDYFLIILQILFLIIRNK